MSRKRPGISDPLFDVGSKWSTFPGNWPTPIDDSKNVVKEALPVEGVIRRDKYRHIIAGAEDDNPRIEKYRNESTLADRVKQKVKDKWGKKPTPEELALEAQKEADIKASLAAIEDKVGPMTVSPSDMARQHDYDGHLLPNSGAMEKLKTPRGILTSITKMVKTTKDTEWRMTLTINDATWGSTFRISDMAAMTMKEGTRGKFVIEQVLRHVISEVTEKVKEGIMQDLESHVTKIVGDPWSSDPDMFKL